VHDTGIGISAGQLRNIFEAFHRLEVAQSDELGLGLFVASRAVELLQHQLEVRSIVGRGSRSAVLANVECRLVAAGADYEQNCRSDLSRHRKGA
jgi:signal transduction histidine kinase